MSAVESAGVDSRTSLTAGRGRDIAAVQLDHHPVAPAQNGGGAPTTGVQPLGWLADTELGVWELSAGTMYDVEVDEVFVVTAGRGLLIIEALPELPEQRTELYPGVVVRLSEGMRTTWIITEALRKFYVLPRAPRVTTENPGVQS